MEQRRHGYRFLAAFLPLVVLILQRSEDSRCQDAYSNNRAGDDYMPVDGENVSWWYLESRKDFLRNAKGDLMVARDCV